jgi:hypothetical protein
LGQTKGENDRPDSRQAPADLLPGFPVRKTA